MFGGSGRYFSEPRSKLDDQTKKSSNLSKDSLREIEEKLDFDFDEEFSSLKKNNDDLRRRILNLENHHFNIKRGGTFSSKYIPNYIPKNIPKNIPHASISFVIGVVSTVYSYTLFGKNRDALSS